MSDKATARPWIARGPNIYRDCYDLRALARIAECKRHAAGPAGVKMREAEANARLIVRAVNNAEGLAETLRLRCASARIHACEALAKWDAEGGEDA